MSRIFSYKVVRDYGFAPNPFHGYCTLATCKPQIRSVAEINDLVVGCGSAQTGLEGQAVFAMRVSEKLTFQQYWSDPRFSAKKPNLSSSRAQSYGDNIYHRELSEWIQEDSHHSYEGGGMNISNRDRDTSADCVLIGIDFIYWGGNGPSFPDELRGGYGDDIYPSSRSHRSVYGPEMIEAVTRWFDGFPFRGYLGRPFNWRAKARRKV